MEDETEKKGRIVVPGGTRCDQREMVPHCGFDMHFSDNE